MPLDPACKLEFEEDELDGCRRLARLPDEFVDRHRRRSEQFGDAAPIALARIGRNGSSNEGPRRFTDHPRVDRPDRLDHIVDILDQRRAFADKSIDSCT